MFQPESQNDPKGSKSPSSSDRLECKSCKGILFFSKRNLNTNKPPICFGWVWCQCKISSNRNYHKFLRKLSDQSIQEFQRIEKDCVPKYDTKTLHGAVLIIGKILCLFNY